MSFTDSESHDEVTSMSTNDTESHDEVTLMSTSDTESQDEVTSRSTSDTESQDEVTSRSRNDTQSQEMTVVTSPSQYDHSYQYKAPPVLNLEVNNASHHESHTPSRFTHLSQQQFDLLSVIMPEPDVEEENVSVYISGYLCHRVFKKFQCSSCHSLLFATDNERDILSDKYVFLNNKQFDSASSQGLFPPSSRLLMTTQQIEKLFRMVFPMVMNSSNILQLLYSEIIEKVNMDSIICSTKCEKISQFILQLYITMRLKFEVKIQNSEAKAIKHKRSRKYLKVAHL